MFSLSVKPLEASGRLSNLKLRYVVMKSQTVFQTFVNLTPLDISGEKSERLPAVFVPTQPGEDVISRDRCSRCSYIYSCETTGYVSPDVQAFSSRVHGDKTSRSFPGGICAETNQHHSITFKPKET